MKELSKYLLIALLTTLLSFQIAAASPLATFNQKVFFVPDRGPVLETYIEIAANSIVLRDDGSGILTGQVQLTLIFKQDSAIVTFDKKTINSPEMTRDNLTDFLDVQRFVLKPGEYTLDINLKDMGDPEGIVQSKQLQVTIPEPPSGVFISDIELISGLKKTDKPGVLSKSGYDLIPMVHDDRLSSQMRELILYAEIYGAVKNTSGEYLVRAYLEDTKTSTPVETSFKLRRMNASEVNPVLLRLPIENLKGGDYNVVVEARSRENELLASQKLPVTRLANPKPAVAKTYTDEEIDNTWVSKYSNKFILFEYLKSLRPIAGRSEKKTIDNTFRKVEDVDLKYLQRYFYTFWETRNDTNSEQAWLDYKVKVAQADNEFGSQNKRGYETDQGRVYLQYGAPDDIVDQANEPSTYPYRIWRYYKLGDFNNVKFVFYDPQRIGNDYQLLHSENIRGEITNYRWKLMLERPSFPQNDLDRTNTMDQFGRQVDELYENPR